MKLIIAKMIKTVFSALLGKRMFFWGVEYLAKLTDNLVDDNIVKMTKAADEGNQEDIIKYAQQAIEEATMLIKKAS